MSRAIGPSNLTLTVVAGCILSNRERAAAVDTALERQMEDKMDRLKGKVILISGGARGQGAAEARLFVTEGARVVIGDVIEPEGQQLASELGHAATFVRHDVTQERDWETAVNTAENWAGYTDW